MIRHRSYRSSGRRASIVRGLLACLFLLAVCGGLGYQFFFRGAKKVDQGDLITEVVARGAFDHIVLEQGEIESSLNTEIVCEVKSRGSGGVAILWVVDEGTLVKAGDKLVELDSSELEVKEKEQKIQVITEEARVATAKAMLAQAKIAREEYLEGIFKTEEAALMSEAQVAEQDLRRAKLAFQSSERLVFKGLINSLQLDADRYSVANAETQLSSAQARLEVLRKLTKERFLVQYDSDIESAVASVKAAESELFEEQNELDEIVQQIDKCVIYAPADGVVVHANKFSNRGGNAEFVVEPGSTVRERQTIIRLPNPSLMQVKCKVNESRITLIKEGMPARLTVDAIPDLKLVGRVTKVNRYAEPGSWFSSAIKEYATIVEIIDPPAEIRTGMTAEAQIFVEQLDDAIQIPIQGLYEHGGEMFTLIQRAPGKFETAKVGLQATNDTMASISSGVRENDRIVLNLRDHLSLMELPEIEEQDNSEMRKIRASTVGNSRGSDAKGDQKPGSPTTKTTVSKRGGPGSGSLAGRGQAGASFAKRGRPDVKTIVAASMQRSDTNKDGKLSADELASMDDQRKTRMLAADENGDGAVSKAELTKALKKRFSNFSGAQG